MNFSHFPIPRILSSFCLVSITLLCWSGTVAHALPIIPRPTDVNNSEEVADGKAHQLALENNVLDAAALKRHDSQQNAPGIAINEQGVQLPNIKEADANHDLKVIGEHLDKIEKLDKDQLEPVDHLDIVKMEQDGHVNKEYHKEMFLGEEHDEFKVVSIENAATKLEEVIKRADLDKDGSLSSQEMEEWIKMKMNEHFEEAKEENDHIFKHLDPDGDGFVNWKEYYVHFLLSRGFDMKNSLQHAQDYDDSVQLDQNDKDALVSYKFRWMDADTDPMDNKLNKEEFMAFRHPEHSKRSLETMAGNVLSGIDTDGDKIITLEEFIMLPPGEVENEEYAEMDRKWQAERKKEFVEIIDLDHNGKADLREMKNYLDPTNPLQARLEADSLISLMDDNHDNFLSKKEILKHSDIFINSKIINFAANVHDEM